MLEQIKVLPNNVCFLSKYMYKACAPIVHYNQKLHQDKLENF